MTVRNHFTSNAAVWIWFATCAFGALAPWAVAAQDESVADWQRSSLGCEPACRDGYECKRGECLPICSPPCADGLLCSAGGACIRAEPPSAPAFREPAAGTCTPECRSAYTCLSGRCVSLCNPICAAGEQCTANGECVQGDLDREPQLDTAPSVSDPSERSVVNLHLDVLGALQFGLAPTVEVGEAVSGYVRLRALNSGLLSHFVLGRDSRDDLRWGATAALGLHLFASDRGNLRGFYGGVALEYAFLETRDVERDFATYRTHALIPQLDLGYRWGFGGLLVGLAGRLGLAVPFRNRVSAFGDQGCAFESSCRREYDVAFIPSLAVDLGWFIPRSPHSQR